MEVVAEWGVCFLSNIPLHFQRKERMIFVCWVLIYLFVGLLVLLARPVFIDHPYRNVVVSHLPEPLQPFYRKSSTVLLQV